jgi:hypothetical protein
MKSCDFYLLQCGRKTARERRETSWQAGNALTAGMRSRPTHPLINVRPASKNANFWTTPAIRPIVNSTEKTNAFKIFMTGHPQRSI